MFFSWIWKLSVFSYTRGYILRFLSVGDVLLCTMPIPNGFQKNQWFSVTKTRTPTKHRKFTSDSQVLYYIHLSLSKHQVAFSVSNIKTPNKPRCYPQQQLGNNASKENLRARLFPILPPQPVNRNLPWKSRNSWIGTCRNLPGTRGSERGSEPAPEPSPELVNRNLVRNLPRNLPGTRESEPSRNPWFGTWFGTCPEPVVQNLPRNLPGTRGSDLPGTCGSERGSEPAPEPVVRNLPRNLPGTRDSEPAPEPPGTCPPEAAPEPPRSLYWQRPHG